MSEYFSLWTIPNIILAMSYMWLRIYILYILYINITMHCKKFNNFTGFYNRFFRYFWNMTRTRQITENIANLQEEREKHVIYRNKIFYGIFLAPQMPEKFRFLPDCFYSVCTVCGSCQERNSTDKL